MELHTPQATDLPVDGHPISGDYRVDALIYASGARWNHTSPVGTAVTVTYSFAASAPSYAPSFTAAGFQQFTASQQAAVREFFSTLSQQVGIDLREVSDAGPGGKVRMWNAALTSGQAYSMEPPVNAAGETANGMYGDAVFSTAFANALQQGSFGYWLLPHVLGHSLGLENIQVAATGTKGNYLGTAENKLVYTAMSLVAHDQGIYNDGLSAYDLLALRYLYGARSYHASQDTYDYSDAQGQKISLLVDDGGIDTLVFSSVTAPLVVDLRPGAISSVGRLASGAATKDNFVIALDAVIEGVVGSAGDDSFTLNAADNQVNGGGGTDTAIFSGSRANFTVTATAGGYTVKDRTGGQGTDTLTNIERVKFGDKSVNLTVGDTARSVTTAQLDSLIELYTAYVNRVPDADGMAFWIGQLKAGQSLNQIGEAFYGAALQFSSLTGYSATMTNGDFVTLVYKNVLGRSTPDAEGLAFWSGALASGTANRGTLVSSMLSSAHTFKGNAQFGFVADLLDNKTAVGKLFAITNGLVYNTSEDSISQGMAIAAAVTPTSTTAAISLIGVTDGLAL